VRNKVLSGFDKSRNKSLNEMKNSRLITLDQIFEISQPQLIAELMAVGLPSEKISDAISLLRDIITTMLRSGLKNNKINDLVLLLNGAFEDNHMMHAITEEYATMLSLTLGLDSSVAGQASHRLLPFALRATGDYLPTSYLNQTGINRLLDFNSSAKSVILNSYKTFSFKAILRGQFTRFTERAKLG
jgi:hypothetical protein